MSRDLLLPLVGNNRFRANISPARVQFGKVVLSVMPTAAPIGLTTDKNLSSDFVQALFQRPCPLPGRKDPELT
jgi:hypothetical protein